MDETDDQPFWRRLITRLIGVIPAAAVAASVGPAGLNTMLVASQVLLSIVLPTVIFPLVWLCSREDLMTVHGPEIPVISADAPIAPEPAGSGSGEAEIGVPEERTEPMRIKKCYRSPKWITWLGYILFGILVVANSYVIVELALGNAD